MGHAPVFDIRKVPDKLRIRIYFFLVLRRPQFQTTSVTIFLDEPQRPITKFNGIIICFFNVG